MPERFKDSNEQERRCMDFPLDISFRNMDPSPAVEARIREKAEKLERFHDRIIACTVVVEAPHRHHNKGKLYSVRIDISVPGTDLVVDRAKPLDHSHEDVYVAVRDAFNAAARQLEDYTRRMRGDVKTHTDTRGGAASPAE
jgi:ribosomal subunit interface protein